jgi:hypothetical protein
MEKFVHLYKSCRVVKYLLLWFPLLMIAIINGALRDLWYKNFTGELAAHQVSTVTLILFFSLFIGFVFQKYPPSSSTQALLVGVIWVGMTLAFEFGFGKWRGNSWEQLLQDYNVFEGRLWLLVPLWVMIAPYLFYRWRLW